MALRWGMKDVVPAVMLMLLPEFTCYQGLF